MTDSEQGWDVTTGKIKHKKNINKAKKKNDKRANSNNKVLFTAGMK